MGANNSNSGAVAAIIPAGGAGRRFGPCRPKQFVNLAGWPILAHTLARFDQTPMVDQIVVVVPYDQVKSVRKEIIEFLGFLKPMFVVAGGETRQESVYQGFLALGEDVGLVVIHDAVRPLVRVSTIEAVIASAREHGAAIAAVPVRDTLKRVEDHVVRDTLDRERVWQAQTPQAFNRDSLAEALAKAKQDNFLATDDAALVERLGLSVHVVHGAADNIKITMPEDLVLAENIMQLDKEFEGNNRMRVGMGFDVHTLVEGRKLMLGGVEVPFEKGLAGHSDADVLAHALCDALLGAAGLGDLGCHFPDTDPKWKDAAGADLLKRTYEKVCAAGYALESADVTLLAERPKIKDLAPQMNQALAEALAVDVGRVNVKATTTEGLGPVGREEGLAAMAVALLTRRAV